MTVQEILSFLNFNLPAKTNEYHFVNYKNGSQTFGYFNSLTGDNIESNTRSFTIATSKEIVMLSGIDIEEVTKKKTIP